MKFVAIFVLFSCTLHGFQSATNSPEFIERFRWSPVDYAFEEAGLQINRSSYNLWDYVVEKVYPWKDKLFFVQTTLAFRPNSTKIPLAYVDLKTTAKSPLLIPYPKDLVHRFGSIRTLYVDICDRLWFIDHEHPTLYIIDLNQNQIIRNVTLGHARLRYLTLEALQVEVNKSDCANAHAYMLLANRAIMVYRLRDDQYWTAGKPVYTNSKDRYIQLPSSLGLSHIGIVDLDGKGNRVLFVQPFRSAFLLTVPIDILRNSENVTSSVEFTVFGVRAESEKTDFFHYDDRNSIMFYSIPDESVFGCWNAKRFPNEYSVNTTHRFKASAANFHNLLDMKSDDQNNLLVVTKVLDKQRHYIVYLHTISIKELVKDTVCDIV